MLNVRTEATGADMVVHAAGEVDMSSFDALSAPIRQALERPGVTGVTVDLAGVSFLDSNGIRVLVESYRLASKVGARLVVRNAQEPVDRVLRVTGVADLLGLPPVPPGRSGGYGRGSSGP